MFKRHLLSLAGWALVLPAHAAAPELDEALMENVEIINESLASNLSLKAAAAATTDAQDLDALFADVEAWFVQRGDAPDGVGYAKRTREAAAGIVKAVGEGQFEAASNLATELSRTCKACHRKYKPD
jgi:hypothetical protein